MLAAVLDAGAEEVNDLGESFEVVSEAADLVAVRTALAARPGSSTSRPTSPSCPRSRWNSTRTSASRVFRLIEALEDSDDVQNVYANYSVPDEVMEKLG